MTPQTSIKVRAINKNEFEEHNTTTGTSSSSTIPKGVTTRQQAIELKPSDVRLICAEEIDKYHNKLQESFEDLRRSINQIANVLTMTREEVGNQLATMQGRSTEYFKELPSPNDGNEVIYKTESLNGVNEVSKVRREDDAMKFEDEQKSKVRREDDVMKNEYNHGGNKSTSRQLKHAQSKSKNRSFKQSLSTRPSDKSSKKKSMHKGRRNNSDSTDSSSSSGDDFKRSKKSNTYVNTDSEDSEYSYYTSSDLEEGPRLTSLKETNTRSVSLCGALSYRTYRHDNISQKFSNALSKDPNKMRKQMTTHIPDYQQVDGSDPVSITKFLEEDKEASDYNKVSEGAAIQLCQYVLRNTANKSPQLHFRSTMSALSNSCCGAIQFLLTMYAAEQEVNGKCSDICFIQHNSGEGFTRGKSKYLTNDCEVDMDLPAKQTQNYFTVVNGKPSEN
jgi:ribosomal protein S17E